MNKLFKRFTSKDSGKEPKMLFLSFPLREQIVFTKRLSLLVKSGVSLMSGLRMLKNQTKSKSRSFIIGKVTSSVEQGQYLSISLSQFPKLFGAFFINIIHIGELSGTLQENLSYLSEELQKKLALRRKVRSAMIYPALIIVATFGMSILLTVFLFPKVLPIFDSLQFELPITTRILIGLSGFMISYWYALIIGLTLFVGGFILALRRESFKYQFHRILLKVPIFGSLIQRYQLANISRTLGLLLRTDVRIVKALQITADTTTNLVFRRRLEELSVVITRGDKISSYTYQYPKLFPAMMSQMIEVGETTGSLPDTFNFLAEMYEAEVDEITKNMSTVLEPALMVTMGLVVGFVAVSIITPIYSFTQSIHP